VTRQNR